MYFSQRIIYYQMAAIFQSNLKKIRMSGDEMKYNFGKSFKSSFFVLFYYSQCRILFVFKCLLQNWL